MARRRSFGETPSCAAVSSTMWCISLIKFRIKRESVGGPSTSTKRRFKFLRGFLVLGFTMQSPQRHGFQRSIGRPRPPLSGCHPLILRRDPRLANHRLRSVALAPVPEHELPNGRRSPDGAGSARPFLKGWYCFSHGGPSSRKLPCRRTSIYA